MIVINIINVCLNKWETLVILLNKIMDIEDNLDSQPKN